MWRRSPVSQGLSDDGPDGGSDERPRICQRERNTIDGVKVIVMPDHRLPLVSWSLTMRRGSQSDPKGREDRRCSGNEGLPGRPAKAC